MYKLGVVISSSNISHKAWQALELWIVFIAILVLVNGTIPFVLGVDMRAWTYSKTKLMIFSPLIYSGLFLIAPLILLKGWKTARRPAFIVPLMMGTLGIFLWPFFPFAASVVVIVLAYLHFRFNLSGIGIRSSGWKGDVSAIVFVGALYFLLLLFQPFPLSFSFSNGMLAALNRLFANPASTVENLFYFGFLTERLSHKLSRWLTPPMVGAMYTFHEMTNPEYWYGGMSFGFVFVGVMIYAALYLWRRSAVIPWLSDGVGRFISNL